MTNNEAQIEALEIELAAAHAEIERAARLNLKRPSIQHQLRRVRKVRDIEARIAELAAL